MSKLFAMVKKEFGARAAKNLEETLLLIEKFNPSGRYTVSRVWHRKEAREATVHECVKLLAEVVKMWIDLSCEKQTQKRARGTSNEETTT